MSVSTLSELKYTPRTYEAPAGTRSAKSFKKKYYSLIDLSPGRRTTWTTSDLKDERGRHKDNETLASQLLPQAVRHYRERPDLAPPLEMIFTDDAGEVIGRVDFLLHMGIA